MEVVLIFNSRDGKLFRATICDHASRESIIRARVFRTSQVEHSRPRPLRGPCQHVKYARHSNTLNSKPYLESIGHSEVRLMYSWAELWAMIAKFRIAGAIPWNMVPMRALVSLISPTLTSTKEAMDRDNLSL